MNKTENSRISELREQISVYMQLKNNRERLMALLSLMRTEPSSVRDIIVAMADGEMVPPDVLSGLFTAVDLFEYKPRPVKTILLTVMNLYYGGGPRSSAALACALARARDSSGRPLYKVILVSDEPASEKDYKLLPSVIRYAIPARGSDGSYMERALALGSILDEGVDLVIQATKRDGDSLWDMLLCKSHPSRPAYVHVFRTSFGSLLLDTQGEWIRKRKQLYQYADALVVLNKADAAVWNAYVRNVTVIPNMVDMVPGCLRRNPCRHRVLWAGRIMQQKQPFELINIAEKAVQLLPDIRFDMMGDLSKSKLVRKLRDAIEKKGLQNHVFLSDHQTDMDEQYEQADIFCHTALFEGFGRVLYEAAAHALPVVMYKIPGLDYKEHLPAIRECGQRDSDRAAQVIVRLLTDREEYAQTSREIVSQFSAFARQDFVIRWQELFSRLEQGTLSSERKPEDQALRNTMDALIFYHLASCEKREGGKAFGRETIHTIIPARKKLSRVLRKARRIVRTRLKNRPRKTEDAPEMAGNSATMTRNTPGPNREVREDFYANLYLPDRVRLEASTLCQLRCAGCGFQRGGHDDLGRGYLTIENFRRFAEMNPFVRSIELSNYGEIFLNPDLVDIMYEAKKRGIILTALNGTNFNTVSDTQIRAMVETGFKKISISIDGASQESYSRYRIGGDFQKVIDNIKKLQAMKKAAGSQYPILRWQFILMEHNELDIGKAKEIASELEIPIVFKYNWDPKYKPVHRDYICRETGMTALTCSEYEEEYETSAFSRQCRNFFLMPQINWDGRLLGCCTQRYAVFDINVFDVGLKAALMSEKYVAAKKCLLTIHPDAETYSSCTCYNCLRRLRREEFNKALEL